MAMTRYNLHVDDELRTQLETLRRQLAVPGERLALPTVMRRVLRHALRDTRLVRRLAGSPHKSPHAVDSCGAPGCSQGD